jgi:hypothetical protein
LYFTPQPIGYLQQSTFCGVVFSGSVKMFTNKDTPDSKTYPTPEDATERMQIRGELFKLLNPGFGQWIANKMSSNIVNTLENARATLSRFQG